MLGEDDREVIVWEGSDDFSIGNEKGGQEAW